MLSLRVKKTGDWDGPMRWIRMARAELERSAEAMMEQVTGDAGKDLQKRVKDQSLPMAPLSPVTLALKALRRLDMRILIATKEYVGKMGSYRIGKWQWGVGLPAGNHKPSGMTYAKLWEILEYGTVTIPARPHVRPVAMAASDKIPAAIRKYGFVYLGRNYRPR